MTSIVDDPVALQVVWTRLIAIADEAAATLRRTSFSPIVRESNDFACVIVRGAKLRAWRDFVLASARRGAIPCAGVAAGQPFRSEPRRA
jgi:hypothetical protein